MSSACEHFQAQETQLNYAGYEYSNRKEGIQGQSLRHPDT